MHWGAPAGLSCSELLLPKQNNLSGHQSGNVFACNSRHPLLFQARKCFCFAVILLFSLTKLSFVFGTLQLQYSRATVLKGGPGNIPKDFIVLKGKIRRCNQGKTAEEQQDLKKCRALSDGCVSHPIHECNSSMNIKCYFAMPFQMQFLFFNLPSLLTQQL